MDDRPESLETDNTRKRKSSSSLLSTSSSASKKLKSGCDSSSVTDSLEAASIFSADHCAPSPATSLSSANTLTTTNGSIFNLKKEDLETVFRLALLPKYKSKVYPYYRQGMHARGVYSDGTGKDIIREENIELEFLRVNKVFHDLGTSLFYGENQFYFSDPQACKWWMKHIGTNFSKIRTLVLTIGTRYMKGPEQYDPLNLCQEERWYQCLCWLEHRHRLTCLGIVLKYWKDVKKRDTKFTTQQKVDMKDARELIFEKLQQFRGIPNALIFTMGFEILDEDDCARLAMLMAQRKMPWAAKRNGTLAQLMEDCKATTGLVQEMSGESDGVSEVEGEDEAWLNHKADFGLF